MYRSSYSVYLLQYHIVTKYRNPVLQGNVKTSVYKTIEDMLEMLNCIIKEVNGEEDHMYLLIKTPSDIKLHRLIQILKTRSARFARRDYPDKVAKYYWNNAYFISTISENTLTNFETYIRKQGMKSKNRLIK
ncbi:IS200/IS605 family transposase [Holdemanella biformis]|uniref:IS200/IS605 family transposase n=1 Tax=Holdemanella biformis TaxID=1735 RepID=UPI002E75EBD6|nr:IS200/IS605 family transposase [Holdemanella biformis]